jgi:hypothetical protein
MELLITPWLVSLLPLKRWERHHTLSLEDTTHHKLLEEQMDLKLSKTMKTGLELGLSKDKACTTEQLQCKSQERILPTQPSLILEVHNFLFHLMFLRKSDKSGLKLSQVLIVRAMPLSVTFQSHVSQLHQRLSQLDSR